MFNFDLTQKTNLYTPKATSSNTNGNKLQKIQKMYYFYLTYLHQTVTVLFLIEIRVELNVHF